MGREMRRVPGNWEHPRLIKDGYVDCRGKLIIREIGEYVPLFYYNFKECLEEYHIGKEKWLEGYMDNLEGGWEKHEYENTLEDYEAYNGVEPKEEDYMPYWKEEEKTHYQMYETCTEGTPISPVFDCPKNMCRWLADNNASAFGSMTATYEEWLNMCLDGGSSVSMIIKDGKMMSGVSALSELGE